MEIKSTLRGHPTVKAEDALPGTVVAYGIEYDEPRWWIVTVAPLGQAGVELISLKDGRRLRVDDRAELNLPTHIKPLEIDHLVIP